MKNPYTSCIKLPASSFQSKTIFGILVINYKPPVENSFLSIFTSAVKNPWNNISSVRVGLLLTNSDFEYLFMAENVLSTA